MRGRVGRDPHLVTQHAFGPEAPDGLAVALVRVQAHHLDIAHLPAGLLLRPSLQAASVSAVEHAERLPGVSIDRRGDEAAPAEPRRRCHNGLVDAHPGRRADPARVLGCLPQRGERRRPHGVPAHPQAAGQPRHRRPQSANRVVNSPAGQHPARTGQARPLGPGPRIAPTIRASPDTLVPTTPSPASRPPPERPATPPCTAPWTGHEPRTQHTAPPDRPGTPASTTASPASTRSATTANPNAPKPKTEPA